jgi:hypothetical protein
MARQRSSRSSERGAVLVHTAIVILCLIAFTTFVVDYGTLWASRRQAQNAADAGALAGAVTLAFEDPTLGVGGGAYSAAQQIVTRHRVWDAVPGYRILVGDANDNADDPCPMWEQDGVTCVRVDVHRDGTNNSTQLPMFFCTLMNKTQQRLRATATAHVTGANSVRCILPFIMADRWADVYDTSVVTNPFTNDGQSGTAGWTPNDLYEPGPGRDYYNPPYRSPTTGWTVASDYGRQIVLHDPIGTYSAGWSGMVDLPNDSGQNDWRENVWNCDVNTYSVGIAAENNDCSGYSSASTTPEQAAAGCLGIKTGWAGEPADQGITGSGPVPDGVIGQDSGAIWSWTANNGRGAVVDASGNLNMDSPRIRPVPIMDIDHYMTHVAGCSGTTCVVKISNIVGFFVEGMCNTMLAQNRLDPGIGCVGDKNQWSGQVVGRIVTMPGTYATGNGAPITPSTFVKLVRLIR